MTHRSEYFCFCYLRVKLVLSGLLNLDNKYFGCKFTLLPLESIVLKNLETDKTNRRIRKTKEDILRKVKDSIMIEEIVNKDIEKTSICIKSPDEAVQAVNNMEKNIRTKKSNILCLVYQQDQIFEKFKVNESFIDMVKELRISKSTILFKISIVKSVSKYPRMKKSSLSPRF